MRTNDQWFEPGDKVMFIGRTAGGTVVEVGGGAPKAGVIYCVEDFAAYDYGNQFTVVGGGGWSWVSWWPDPFCYAAQEFRKAEEVRLILQAFSKQPKEQKVETTS